MCWLFARLLRATCNFKNMEKTAAGADLERGGSFPLTMQKCFYAHRGTHILTELWLCQAVLGVLKKPTLPVSCFVSGDFWVISEQETLHHGMVLGKLSEQLQLVKFILSRAGSTVCWVLIQTCACLLLRVLKNTCSTLRIPGMESSREFNNQTIFEKVKVVM